MAPNASVNVYMGHGGTSFGFEAGANIGDGAFYMEPTSYDYDGLISEAGDLTPKYFAIKEVVGKYLPLPNIHVEPVVPKGDYGAVNMEFVADLSSFYSILSEGR